MAQSEYIEDEQIYPRQLADNNESYHQLVTSHKIRVDLIDHWLPVNRTSFAVYEKIEDYFIHYFPDKKLLHM